MQIWLQPIDFVGTSSESPLCAVLLRVAQHIRHDKNLDAEEDKLKEIRESLYRLTSLAARNYPGNLREHSAHLDPDQYACEVLRAEEERIDYPRLLRRVLQLIDELYNDQVEWCLPILDAELFLSELSKFIEALRGHKWFSIYIVSDIDLSRFFGHNRNVKFITETEFVAMNVLSDAMEMFSLKANATLLPEPELAPTDSTWKLGMF